MSASSRTRTTIGRDVELDAIQEMLAGLDDGPCGLFFLGPPGIGKTKVWAEGVELARSRGLRVLTTRPGSLSVARLRGCRFPPAVPARLAVSLTAG